MPIYEYRCTACHHTFARLRSIDSNAPLPECPSCGSPDTERVLSSFAAGSSQSRIGAGSGSPSCGGAGGG